jgi:hypothetical protein
MASRIGRRIGWAVLGTALVTMIGGYLWARSTLARANRARAERLESSIERHRDAFLADQALAAGALALAVRTGDRDAGPFLNPRIPWNASRPVLDAWRRALPADAPSLALEKARTGAIPSAWWKTPPEAWRGLDFGWMAALGAYDRWDLDVASPRSGPEVPHWDAPLPDFATLAAWSRLRLAKGLADGRPAEAAAEVADVARLLLTTEHLLGVMSGIQVLTLSDRAREEAGAPPGAWPGLDPATAAAARRAAQGAVTFFRLDTPDRFAGDASRIAFARCAAIEEGLRVELFVRPVLGPARPEAFARLGRALGEARDCRLTRLRRAWLESADHAWGREEVCGEAAPAGPTGPLACEVQLLALRLPPVRSLYGAWLTAIGGPDWLAGYERPARAGTPEPPRP